jgi:hypothetical protein
MRSDAHFDVLLIGAGSWTDGALNAMIADVVVKEDPCDHCPSLFFLPFWSCPPA